MLEMLNKKMRPYFDVIEEVDAIIDKSGTTVTAEIQGYVSWFICFTPQMRACIFYFSTKTYVVGTQRTVSMRRFF